MDPQPEVRERIERATIEQWTDFVCSSARAVLGEDWREDIGAMPEKELPNQQRVQWLAERVEQWTRSRSFIESQTSNWLEDRCGGETHDHETWDYRLHDAWVRHSISRNESFLTFVQSQLAGDLLFEEPEARLGTATWFRSPSLDDYEEEILLPRAPMIPPRKSPSLEELPTCLQWTSISRVPWLYCNPSESQRDRLVDLEASMVSVLRTEQRDWERLLREDLVAKWHRSQSGWPIPNPEDMTFNLSNQQVDASANRSNDPHPSYAFSSPWRYSKPWTLILEFHVSDLESMDGRQSIALIRQRSSCPDPTTTQQNCSIHWKEGKIGIRLTHCMPTSYLELETEPVFQKAGNYSLAIIYDGFPSANSIRLWADGRWLPTRALHDRLVRDFTSSDAQVLEVTSSDSGIQLNQLECYRSVITSLELEGWRQEVAWKDWESCSEDERQASREHYARRVDSQWRYQRESLLFYVDSFASVMSRVGMVPLADAESSVALVMPASLVAMLGPEGDSRAWPLEDKWNPEQRRLLAVDCNDKRAITLSDQEIARQWRRMLASTGRSDNRVEIDRGFKLGTLSSHWSKTWNRRELTRALIFSDAWVATALDSTP